MPLAPAEYTFPIPYWAKSPLTASAVLRYRKLNITYAHWALQDDTIDLPIIDMDRDAINIPIRYKAEVERSLRNPTSDVPMPKWLTAGLLTPSDKSASDTMASGASDDTDR